MIQTKQQLLAASPDEKSTERAKQCSNQWKWKLLEGNERAVWGEYSTPGKPFIVAVDLNGPGFKCSCPSRKFPCKHALGLGILLFENNGLFKVGHNIPEDIENWLEKRDARAEKGRKAEYTSPKDQNDTEKIAEEKIEWNAATITSEKRIAEMKAGLGELKTWLEDLMRQGIASLESQGTERLFSIATRMVDAKLGSIGRRLRALIPILGQDDWHEQVMTTVGELYLLMNGLSKIENLPPLFQTEILTLAGVNIKKDLLLEKESVYDIWQVVGVVMGREEQLTSRRTWLMGENTGETAMLLDFSFGNQGFEQHWNVGNYFEGGLIFYPSVFPQRAILAAKEGVPMTPPVLNGFSTIKKFKQGLKEAFAKNPWLMNFPAYFDKAIPVFKNKKWFLADESGAAIPMAADDLKGWKILAISCGEPIRIFGEWREGQLTPLSWE